MIALPQGIKELVGALQSRGVAVYLISGGFRELTVPIARELGVPCDNVFANRMNWQARPHLPPLTEWRHGFGLGLGLGVKGRA